jgi:predicted GH43/DUF377 family glycosyl hydrolase
MKLKRFRGDPILERDPEHDWERGSVLNPGVIYENGFFRMIYRATNDVHPDQEGAYMSSLGYAESVDGMHFQRFEEPIISPTENYENGLGCEDPRVTKIDGVYYLYYTAVGGQGHEQKVRIALATSKDFVHWNKHGIVGPDLFSKAACLFPEKINGKYTMLFTYELSDIRATIMMVQFDELYDLFFPSQERMNRVVNEEYDECVVFRPSEGRGNEVGAVPIKTPHGWLFIYSALSTVDDHTEWSISAALLDLHDPRKILANVDHILKPETERETHGVVDHVAFPEGAIVFGENLYVYYGSGDQGICLAMCDYQELLNHLTSEIQT